MAAGSSAPELFSSIVAISSPSASEVQQPVCQQPIVSSTVNRRVMS